MPKDKAGIKGFALMPEAEAKMRETIPDPEIVEEKAEPQGPTAIKCYYFASDEKCPGYMNDECSYVIKNGTMVMAHRSCQQRSQNAEKKAPKVMIR